MAIIKLTQYFSGTDIIRYIYINTDHIISLEERTHNKYDKETGTTTLQTYTFILLTNNSFSVQESPHTIQGKIERSHSMGTRAYKRIEGDL